MGVNTTLEIVESYQGLLIMQYLGLPQASGFIDTIVSPAILPQVTTQDIIFSLAPTSGTFELSYDGNNTAAINWNDSASTIQTKLQAVSGLGSVTVAGSISSLSLTVTFTGIAPPALSLVLIANSLVASAVSVTVDILETDETLPLAIMNAFNLAPGTAIATGVQLDTLGLYAGVSRSGLSISGGTTITLDDASFYQLIQMAIVRNSSGSSLATIQEFLQQFFPGVILLYDNKNMTMTYIISAGGISQDLLQLFISEGLLPSPMGVRTDEIYYVPSTNLFSFRTYELPNAVGSPFNTYVDYQTDWPWLSYQDSI